MLFYVNIMCYNVNFYYLCLCKVRVTFFYRREINAIVVKIDLLFCGQDSFAPLIAAIVYLGYKELAKQTSQTKDTQPGLQN